jgi:protein-tyrosine phosphatase
MSRSDYDEIIKNLWLGNLASTRDYNFLTRNNIKYVLSLTKNNVKLPRNDIEHIQFSLNDKPYEDIISLFNICHNFIECGLLRNNGVLIHCDMGISRSSTVCISYLMKLLNKNFAETLAYVKMKRPIVNPNFGFKAQLLLFDKMNHNLHGDLPANRIFRRYCINDISNHETKFDVRGYLQWLNRVSKGGATLPVEAHIPRGTHAYNLPK